MSDISAWTTDYLHSDSENVRISMLLASQKLRTIVRNSVTFFIREFVFLFC